MRARVVRGSVNIVLTGAKGKHSKVGMGTGWPRTVIRGAKSHRALQRSIEEG